MSKRAGHIHTTSEPILLQSIGGTSKASRYYDEDATRISQKIDEELRVGFFCILISSTGPHTHLQREWARIKDARRKQVKGMAIDVVTDEIGNSLGLCFSDAPRPSRVWQVHSAEAIPAILRSPDTRALTSVVATCGLLQHHQGCADDPRRT